MTFLKKHLLLLSAIAIVAAINLSSCKKKSTSTEMGTFYFHMHSNIDTSEVEDSSELYRDSAGRQFKLTTANFFISDIKLANLDGSTVSFNNVILKTLDSEILLIGQAPVGVYNSVSFRCGLYNGGGASSASPTAAQITYGGMQYDSVQRISCLFMKIEGSADTTAMQTGMDLVPFSYLLWAPDYTKIVSMPVRDGSAYPNYVLTSGGTQYVHMICDYGKLLNGIDFKTQRATNSLHVHPEVAQIIANNMQNAFRYEE